MTYNRKTIPTAMITPTFPVFPRLPNPMKTSSKSIEFGEGNRSPPNDVRWLHKHCKFSSVEFGPGWEKVQNIKYDDLFLNQLHAHIIGTR